MNGPLRNAARRLPPPMMAWAAGALLLVACEEHEFRPPDRAERVSAADSAYSDTLFEGITWSSLDQRRDAGNLVYADECRRCHGPLGQGDSEYARERELPVPSLVRPDWPEGDDVEAVRRLIYVGHPAGMPSWGIGQLTPRQIDAAAFYVVEQLRPEMAGRGDPEDAGTP